MFKTFNTLLRGISARAEDAVTDRFAVDLLDQKIRDSEAGLKAAKLTLASLIRRQRLEQRQFEAIDARIRDLTARAQAALADGAEDLARNAAAAIADLENERAARQATVATITDRVSRLELSLERGARRMADLRQAAATARVVDHERRGQRRLTTHVLSGSDLTEAEELVSRILNQADPFEDDAILGEIDAKLSGEAAQDDLARAGYGRPLKTTADDVLARLKKTTE